MHMLQSGRISNDTLSITAAGAIELSGIHHESILGVTGNLKPRTRVEGTHFVHIPVKQKGEGENGERFRNQPVSKSPLV